MSLAMDAYSKNAPTKIVYNRNFVILGHFWSNMKKEWKIPHYWLQESA